MNDMIIRQAHVEDVDAIYEIETLCFPDPWSHASLFSELTENPRAFYVAAEIDGQVVGYAGMWWILDEGHITNVAVRPGFRNRRIGSQIIETMLDHADHQGIGHYTLEVRASNVAARALYEKYGFEVEGIRPGYYQVGHEDALIMWRHRPAEPEGPTETKAAADPAETSAPMEGEDPAETGAPAPFTP